jgi:probable rRNA maturation factor
MAKYEIEVQVEVDLPDDVQTARLSEAAQKVLELEEVEEGVGMTIVLVDNAHIQQLNRQYRQIDAPTDVLSFPVEPLPEEIEEDQDYLGDILLAYPYIAARAKDEQRSLHDDLALMVVHGTLHLMGYDHDTQENQQEMWAVQAKALAALGVSLDVPDYIHE